MATNYAQMSVGRTVLRHPELLDVIFHVTPPRSTQNVSVTAHTDKEHG